MDSFYCQNCLASNRLGQEVCVRCGTRLMLIVEPAAVRFDSSEPSGFHEEHLLERISSLENRLSRTENQLGQLHSFLGEHFFRTGKMASARDYLELALVASPNNDRVCLLLGLACGDEGDSERAKQLLNDVVKRRASCFAAHYALGRLLVAEERWSDALAEFKQALEVRPSPETHYVVGCVYFRLSRDRMAARHLRKAVAMNGAYSAALYMLGLVYLRAGDKARADDAFQAARAAGQDESRYRSKPKSRLRPDEIPALPPLFSAVSHARKHLVTSGDKRLAEAMLEDALKVGLQWSEVFE